MRGVGALARVLVREALWGRAAVAREVERWRRLAAAIPDPALRADALHALDHKRLNIDGSALFWTIPRARSLGLQRLLVAFDVLADYLDCADERAAHAGIENGLRLHRALVEAVDPRIAVCDHYRLHPHSDDGGYVRALVDACRAECARLPSYEIVRPLLVHAARLTAHVLALNHEPDPARRDVRLRAWAARHLPCDELAWFEQTAGASAWLTVLALLALAADPDREPSEAAAVHRAYLPWLSLLGTMLDSYVDLQEDGANTAHSYFAHYPNSDVATERLGAITRRSLHEAAALPDGPRHVAIASCMLAMYLARGGVGAFNASPVTAELWHAAGGLTRLLVPILRVWRARYRRQAA